MPNPPAPPAPLADPVRSGMVAALDAMRSAPLSPARLRYAREVSTALEAWDRAVATGATLADQAASDQAADRSTTDQAAGPTAHTCNTARPGHALPYGRRAPAGTCARCDELSAGAPRRDGWGSATTRAADDDAQRSADLESHFSSPRHRSGGCGLVCTFGDW